MGIGAALGIGSALIGASSANKAAKSQERAAQNDLALQTRIYDETVARFDPYVQGGMNGYNALQFELGLGNRPSFGGSAPSITEEQYQTDTPVNPLLGGFNVNSGGEYGPQAPQTTTGTRYNVNGQSFDTREAAQAYADQNATGGTDYQGYELTPGYQFQIDQGIKGLDSSAASRGGLYSGATLKAAQGIGQGVANQGYENYLNRLSGVAAGGQSAAGNQANAGANYAAGGSQAYGNIGNAQAAGAIGVGNALQTGIGNQVGLWNYMGGGQAAGGGTSANVLSAPWASGGFWG